GRTRDAAAMTGRLAPPRQLERKAHDARGARLGDDLHRETTGTEVGDRPVQRRALETRGTKCVQVALDADVEVLQVLAHDDEVDALRPRERAAESRLPARRADVG